MTAELSMHDLSNVKVLCTAAFDTNSGDGEGQNEMTYSMGYLRQFCRSFQQNAATTRIFFPDKKL